MALSFTLTSSTQKGQTLCLVIKLHSPYIVTKKGVQMFYYSMAVLQRALDEVTITNEDISKEDFLNLKFTQFVRSHYSSQEIFTLSSQYRMKLTLNESIKDFLSFIFSKKAQSFSLELEKLNK